MSQKPKEKKVAYRLCRIVLAAVVCLAGIAALMCLPHSSSVRDVQDATPAELALLPTRRLDTAQARAPIRGPGEPPELIRIARPRMLDAHPDVAEFRRLERKVLRSTEEQRRRREILSDVSLIRHARERLLAERDGALTREDELERLYRVEYLAATIEDPNNQALAVAFESIRDVILAGNIRSTVPLELQRSLAGDKVELYMALLHDAPEQAAAIAATAQGTPLESLIRYAEEKYHAWTAPEAGGSQ